jgi:hypothetical protein
MQQSSPDERSDIRDHSNIAPDIAALIRATLAETIVPNKLPLIQLRNDMSVRVGKLWVPAGQLGPALSRFTRLVFCLTRNVEHPYALRGSATGLRWQGHHLAFYCKHQIQGFDRGDVVLPLDQEGKVLVSGSTFVEMIPSAENSGEEFGDICAMHFKPEDYRNTSVDRAFFDLIEADNWHGDKESAFLVYGYPTSLRNLEYAEPTYVLSNVRVTQIVTTGKYVRASNAMGVHIIEMQRRTGNYSADGLSGGPVFQLGEDAQGFYCGFAGVILRGSDTSNLLHFLEARVLMQFMRRQATA